MQYNVHSVVHSLIFTKHFILVRIAVDLQPVAGKLAIKWEYILEFFHPFIAGHHAHTFTH